MLAIRIRICNNCILFKNIYLSIQHFSNPRKKWHMTFISECDYLIYLGVGTILYPLFGHQLEFLLRRINPCYVIYVIMWCINSFSSLLWRARMSLGRSIEAKFCLLTTVLAPIYYYPCWSIYCTGISLIHIPLCS